MSEEISFDDHEVISRAEESKKEYADLKKKGLRGFIAGLASKFIGNVMTKKSYQIPFGIFLIYVIGVGTYTLLTSATVAIYLIIVLSIYYSLPFTLPIIKNLSLWLRQLKKK